MSVGKRVSEAIEKMDASDPEGALYAICSAIDATSTKEFNKQGKSSYKKFIHQNLGLITDIAFDGKQILNINLKYDHPNIETDAKGLCTIQDILYHSVRCGLYHQAEIPGNLIFVEENIIKVEDSKLILPSSLIYGFIVAVILSPVNINEKTSKDEILNFYNLQIPINKLWGKKEEFFWLKDVINEVIKIQKKK